MYKYILSTGKKGKKEKKVTYTYVSTLKIEKITKYVLLEQPTISKTQSIEPTLTKEKNSKYPNSPHSSFLLHHQPYRRGRGGFTCTYQAE